MPILEALIFDVDGTLAETEREGHRVAFNRAFAAAGLDWHWSSEQYGRLLAQSGGKERIRFYLQQYHRGLQPPHPDRLIHSLHEAKTEYYKELLDAGKINLRPGVKRLIQEARARGLRLAIATTSALPNAIALLEKTLNPEWFEAIAAGDMVPAKKPAPDVYQYVLDKMGLDPRSCVAFEDSHHGLIAACQAGLKTIVTVNDYTRNQDFSQALLVLNHLGEPDRQPCRVLVGEIGDIDYLDLDQLQRTLSCEMPPRSVKNDNPV